MTATLDIIVESDLHAYANGLITEEEKREIESLLAVDEMAQKRLHQIQCDLRAKPAQPQLTLVVDVIPRVLVVFDPKLRDADGQVERMKELFRPTDLDTEFVAPKSRKLARRVIRARARDFSAIVMGGGDDALRDFLPDLLNSGKPVGILPLGKENLIAENLEIGSSMSDAIKAIEYGNTKSIDVAYANGIPFLHMMSIGFLQKSDLVSDHGKYQIMRLLTRPFAWLSAWNKQQEFDVRATLDGQKQVEFKTDQIYVANAAMVKGNVCLDPKNNLSSGHLSFAAMFSGNIANLIKLVFQSMKGSFARAHSAAVVDVENVHITTSPKKRFSIDGEEVGHTPVKVKLQKQALDVFAPV